MVRCGLTMVLNFLCLLTVCTTVANALHTIMVGAVVHAGVMMVGGECGGYSIHLDLDFEIVATVLTIVT